MGVDLFSNVDLLQKGLQASQMRHDVIANNIANVDTPGFKTSHVEFESFMADALQGDSFVGRRTDPRHIAIGTSDASDVQPLVVTDDDSTMRMDQNNVDIDQQMSELAKNQIYYDTLVRQISGELSRLQLAIEGK